MYIYKREKNNLIQAKNMEYSISNNLGTCLCVNGVLEAKKPYHGLYIKNGKVILENIFEEIEVKDKLYKMAEYKTAIQTVSCDEYINGIDLYENKFSYDVAGVKYSKTFFLSNIDDMLCIEYDIRNETSNRIFFRILPLITYRTLFNMRNANTLRFNQRNIDNGVILNLSVRDSENLFIKANDMVYTKNARILTNIKHEYINTKVKKEIITEDLFSPGEFELTLKNNENIKICFCISTKDFDINKISSEDIRKSRNLEYDKILRKIPDEFVELKDLALGIENLNVNNFLVSTIPFNTVDEYDLKINYENNKDKFIIDLEKITEIICSVEGQYLILDKYKEANIVLAKVRRLIREIDELNIIEEDIIVKIANLKLWYIEILNKFYKRNSTIMDIYFGFIKEMLYSILDENSQKIILKNIKTCALLYNGIKIYENILNKKGFKDVKLSDIAVCTQNLIISEFWIDEKKCMKKNITDKEAIANIDMIYTLSLSFPSVTGSIPIKLLDTIFKELYTPYGLREFPKNSELNDGLIYPKYMAHFVKANLRQNGITRASQKIAYNLVKELIQDISKYVNGGIKKIYHESGTLIDSMSYDLLTNAEIIRLYDMLT